jgi:hypothetical protein
MAMYSLFLFVAGGVCAPILGRVGERMLMRFDPPSPRLEINIIRQDSDGLELYVANSGDAASVIEYLNVCPPKASAVINWDTGAYFDPNFRSAKFENTPITTMLTFERSDPWRVACRQDGLFISLNLKVGDRRVPKDDSTVITFEAPENFVLYSNVGGPVLQYGLVCSVQLIANNDRVSRLFPCLASGVPIPGDEKSE